MATVALTRGEAVQVRRAAPNRMVARVGVEADRKGDAGVVGAIPVAVAAEKVGPGASREKPAARRLSRPNQQSR